MCAFDAFEDGCLHADCDDCYDYGESIGFPVDVVSVSLLEVTLCHIRRLSEPSGDRMPYDSLTFCFILICFCSAGY